MDVPLGHEKFGRLEPCVCRSGEIAENARQRLYELSNLERLSHLTFENFNRSGNPKVEFISPQELASLHDAYDASESFARDLQGWLLLEGSYGCGKTHLAAAIANAVFNATGRRIRELPMAAELVMDPTPVPA